MGRRDTGRDRSAPGRATGSRRRRWLLAVLTVAFLATAYLAATREPTSPAFTAALGGSSTVGLPGRASMLFVGDSFAAGSGTSGPDQGYACLTAELMDWICNLDAQGGTGYLANGAVNDVAFAPFGGRLDDSADRYLADIVIVAGGRNDAAQEPDDVAAAADAYLTRVRELWPDAVLVVISPAFLDSTADTFPFGTAMTDRLKPIVTSRGGILLDPIADGWTPPELAPELVSADGVHPNPAGHEHLARRLADALRGRGLDRIQVTDRLGTAATSPAG